jgi:hypothetical protein
MAVSNPSQMLNLATCGTKKPTSSVYSLSKHAGQGPSLVFREYTVQISWFTSHQVDASMYLQIHGILTIHNPRWLPHFVRHYKTYITADTFCNKRPNQCKHVKEVISAFPVLASNLNDIKPSCHSAVKDYVTSPFTQKPGHLNTLLDYDTTCTYEYVILTETAYTVAIVNPPHR